MQISNQKNNVYTSGCILLVYFFIFIGTIISLIVGGGLTPIIIFSIIIIIPILLKLKKELPKYGYKFKDLFSENGFNMLKDLIEKVGKEKETEYKKNKQLENYEKISEDDLDEEIELETSSIANLRREQFLNRWVSICVFVISFFIVSIALIIFWPDMLNILKYKNVLNGAFYINNQTVRIIFIIFIMFIIFKILKDYFKNSKK